MKILRLRIYLLIFLLSFTLIGAAQSQNNYISRLFVFGDSLSDTGNTSDVFHGLIPKAPPYHGGRFSNGKLWVEGFSNNLNLSSELVFNFAYAGSRANQGRFPVPSLDKQISKYLKWNNNSTDPNALYVIWIGSNDIINDEDKNDDMNVIIKTSNQVKNQLELLINHGAKLFLVPSLPAISRTPRSFETDAENRNTRYSEHIDQMTRTYNNFLENDIINLENKYPYIKFIRFDAYTYLKNISDYAALYGVTNIHQRCNPNGYYSKSRKICSNPQEYFFWDTVHPSAIGHTMLTYFITNAFLSNGYAINNYGYLISNDDRDIYNNNSKALQELVDESRGEVKPEDLIKFENLIL